MILMILAIFGIAAVVTAQQIYPLCMAGKAPDMAPFVAALVIYAGLTAVGIAGWSHSLPPELTSGALGGIFAIFLMLGTGCMMFAAFVGPILLGSVVGQIAARIMAESRGGEA